FGMIWSTWKLAKVNSLRGQGVLTPIVRGTDNLLPECLRNTGHNGHGLAFCRSRVPGQFQNVSGARLFDQPCPVFIDQLPEPFALGRASPPFRISVQQHIAQSLFAWRELPPQHIPGFEYHLESRLMPDGQRWL